MDKETEKIGKWKKAAELFLKKDIRVFIRDIEDNIYLADIILVGEDTITIQCFGPEQRKGKKFILYWFLITKFDEYREK